jgi:hypothetical protein
MRSITRDHKSTRNIINEGPQEHSMSTTEPKKHDEFDERIRAAVLARKDSTEQGECFILPWRMAVNQDVWHEKGLAECGCGIAPDDPQRDKNL